VYLGKFDDFNGLTDVVSEFTVGVSEFNGTTDHLSAFAGW
jgi:hypothetical protein